MTDTSKPSDPAATLGEPPRRFGFWVGLFVVVSCMVGAGILTTSGYTLRETGNPAALLALWFVGGLMALAGTLTVAELATAMPRVGGDYLYVREAYGPGAGLVCGWATFVLGFAAPTAVIARAAIAYLTAPHATWLAEWLPAGVIAVLEPLGATLLILGIAFIHNRGHEESGRFQIAVSSAKLGFLILIGLCGLLFGTGRWDHWHASGWPRGGQWSSLAVGLIYVGYAYSGWNGAAYLAAEIRDPARNLPRCLVGGCVIVMVLYLFLNLTYVYALNPTQMMQRPVEEVGKVAELAVVALFGPHAAGWLSTLIGLSLVASASAYLLAGPRVTLAMARDRVFLPWAAHLHPQRQTPIRATNLHAGLAIGLCWSGTFLQLLDYTAVGLAALTGLMVASIFPLRRRGMPWPFRMPLYPLPPLAFLLLTAWTIAEALQQSDRQLPALLSLSTIALGVPLSYALRRGTGNGTPP